MVLGGGCGVAEEDGAGVSRLQELEGRVGPMARAAAACCARLCTEAGGWFEKRGNAAAVGFFSAGDETGASADVGWKERVWRMLPVY